MSKPTESVINSSLAGEKIVVDPAKRPSALKKIFSHIDQNVEHYIDTLREAVGIQSVSAWTEARSEVLRMVQWTGEKLKKLGCTVEVRKNGEQDTPEGKIPLPPIIFATLGNNPTKKTLLIYGHLDVQPAKVSDGWDSEPFVLTERNGMLYGRGSTDDKGPVLGWLHAIEAYQHFNIEIPVNIKFVLEGMEEVGSEGLDDLLRAQKDKFLSDVDMVCISDNYWLGKDKPCLTYGLRGLVYFFLEVEMGTKDLHSGVFGGSVREAMTDLIWLLDQLLDDKGAIQIPGILDDVCPLTEDETEMYKTIDFDCKAYQDDVGIKELRFPDDKVQTLMNRWRYPCLSIHGIQGAFSDPGAKTVIPRKVIGKFSIRLVPNQTPKEVHRLVEQYLKEKWQERNSPNRMLLYLAEEGIPSWTANPFHPTYRACRQAVAYVYGKKPDMIREGGSMTSVLYIQEVTGKNVLLLPMGASDDGAHSQNEKINVTNYIEGTKVMAAYLHELGKVKGNL